MRVSATNLEAFRRWKADEKAELSDLLAYLRRETPPTDAMRAGTALHKVLELAQDGDALDVVERDGFRFTFRIDGELALQPFRELKIERPLVLDGEAHTLVCVVDTIGGREVCDHKLTGKADAENYTASMQWRANLEWADCDAFTYNLFQQYQPAGEPGHYVITDMVPVTFYRYPGMDDEVAALVAEFLAFIRENAPDIYNKRQRAA
ncbi:MAG: hypothetical protein ACLGH6_09100 [Gammaproteobacteria bacterium]